MTRTESGVVLSRFAPRFDVSAQTVLPDASMGRVAHQVRQDLWRALQSLRGFSPVVAVERTGEGLCVTAGGAVAGAIPPGTGAQIAAVLEDGGNRARWVAHAKRARA